jgi:hypothetical protein
MHHRFAVSAFVGTKRPLDRVLESSSALAILEAGVKLDDVGRVALRF